MVPKIFLLLSLEASFTSFSSVSLESLSEESFYASSGGLEMYLMESCQDVGIITSNGIPRSRDHFIDNTMHNNK